MASLGISGNTGPSGPRMSAPPQTAATRKPHWPRTWFPRWSQARNGCTSISVPCTLIAAELDQVSTPAAMSDLADRLPHATVQILAGAAHMTPFTDPARLGTLLTRSAHS